MEFFARNRSIITFVLIIFVLLVALSFSAREIVGVTLLERAVHRLVSPFQRLVAAILSFGRNMVDGVRELAHLGSENERLRRELDELQFKYDNLVEAKLELERVRALLDYQQEQTGLDLVLARIIARGTTTWHLEVVVDRGRIHGIQAGDAVVIHRGAVGRVVEVFSTSARILLLTDPRSAVAAIVQDGRDGALAEGDSSVFGGIRLSRLPWDFPLEVGDTVVTSRLGDVFPRDHVFVIGTVAEIIPSPDGLIKSARLQSAVDFGRLEEVLIVRRALP